MDQWWAHKESNDLSKQLSVQSDLFAVFSGYQQFYQQQPAFALSRRKQGFESPRERQQFQCLITTDLPECPGCVPATLRVLFVCVQNHISCGVFDLVRHELPLTCASLANLGLGFILCSVRTNTKPVDLGNRFMSALGG